MANPSSHSADRQGADAPTRGIVCMIIGTVLLASNDGVTKWLLATLHPGDVMAWRGVLALPFVAIVLKVEGARPGDLISRAPKLNLLRAFLALACSFLVILSFQVLPLADALAVIFISPLFVTALSGLVLGEKIGWRLWAATVVGFSGAILIVGPSFDAIGIWVLAPLAAAATAAARDIVTRRLGQVDNGPAILVWTMVIGMLGGFATMPFLGATPMSQESWLLMLAAAGMLAVSNRLTIAAFKFASGAVVAPLKYLALIWAGAIGYFVWGDVPELHKVVGAVIIAAAGLYIWRHEVLLERARRG